MRCRNKRRVNAYISTSHDCATLRLELRPWAKSGSISTAVWQYSTRHLVPLRTRDPVGCGANNIQFVRPTSGKTNYSSVAAMLAFMSRSRKRHQLI